MMVKQHLLLILYGLCADVLKGEDAAARWGGEEDGRGVAARWRLPLPPPLLLLVLVLIVVLDVLLMLVAVLALLSGLREV